MALLQLHPSKNCGLTPPLASKSRVCSLGFPPCSGVLKCPTYSVAAVSEKTNRELGRHLDIICQKVISSTPPCTLGVSVSHAGKVMRHFTSIISQPGIGGLAGMGAPCYNAHHSRVSTEATWRTFHQAVIRSHTLSHCLDGIKGS